LSSWRIKPFLRDHVYAGRSLIFLKEIDSTNRFCLREKELLECPGLVVRAQKQSAGIGRMGRRWEQGEGNHLFSSFILRPPPRMERIPTMTLLCGLALLRTIKGLGLNNRVSIKWPNDILLNGKKVSGILCQSTTVDKNKKIIVAGIGVNVGGNANQFSNELINKATTLEEQGITITPGKLLEHIAVQLERIMQDVSKGHLSKLLDEWVQNSMCLGKTIIFHENDRKLRGIITSIDEYGRLIVRDIYGAFHLVESGEINYHYD